MMIRCRSLRLGMGGCEGVGLGWVGLVLVWYACMHACMNGVVRLRVGNREVDGDGGGSGEVGAVMKGEELWGRKGKGCGWMDGWMDGWVDGQLASLSSKRASMRE